MLCEKCKQNNATAFLKQNVNGVEKTYNLCKDCASEFYYNGLNDFNLDLNNLFGLLFTQNSNEFVGSQLIKDVVRCPECGITFKDIVNSGKTGCEQCYTTFQNQILPSIQRIHGKTEHVGKISVKAGEKIRKNALIRELNNKLSEAIKQQDFESAAQIRDQIKDLEKGED